MISKNNDDRIKDLDSVTGIEEHHLKGIHCEFCSIIQIIQII